MKIEYAKCEKCGRMVELNGCGSTANFWQTTLTKVIDFLLPITQKLFRPCADWHDMAYHQGNFSDKSNKDDQILKDAKFHDLCLGEVKNPTNPKLNKVELFLIRHNQYYFRYRANQFYLALKIGGEGVYPKENCLSASRKEVLP